MKIYLYSLKKKTIYCFYFIYTVNCCLGFSIFQLEPSNLLDRIRSTRSRSALWFHC